MLRIKEQKMNRYVSIFITSAVVSILAVVTAFMLFPKLVQGSGTFTKEEADYISMATPLWESAVKIGDDLDNKLAESKSSDIGSVRQFANRNKDKLNEIYGQLKGMSCPEKFASNHEAFKSAVDNHRNYLESVLKVANSKGTVQVYNDLNFTGSAAYTNYSKAKLDKWPSYPSGAFAISGRLKELMTAVNANAGGQQASGSDIIEVGVGTMQPADKEYADQLKELVRLYEASRTQFNKEIASNMYDNYTVSAAYKQRSIILDRLNALNPPNRYVPLHVKFGELLDRSLTAVRGFYQTGDRAALTRDSADITGRFRAIKKALGMR